ncbi:hypothetical protein DPMN_092410 [Dreissena polymorpha]|uniref:Uncharacterized protein n=1 Tax=Dreissena polymorpha TaxID=45954 RepID=A0A9D4R1N0_DREPO|nr:hypothetical protein DPMN_092410 [Dreissena polymorpha]
MGYNGAKYGPVIVPSATPSPEAMALKRHIALLACVAHETEQVCQVSSLWVTYSERIIRDFRLLLWGNGANKGQLAYLRRHFHRKPMALRRHIALLACVAHRAEQVCEFRRSDVTYSER